MSPNGILLKIVKKFKSSLEMRWSPRWGIMRHFWVRVYFGVILAVLVLVNCHLIIKWALGHKVKDEPILTCDTLSVLGSVILRRL